MNFYGAHVLVARAGLCALAACGGSGSSPVASKVAYAHELVLPTRLVADRWFLETTLANGAPIRLFLDSAGGAYLDRSAVMRLKLPIIATKDDDGEPMEGVTFPKFADPQIPVPEVDPYPVTAEEDDLDDGDGMLGGTWFAGKTFAFDYANGRMTLRAPGDLPNVAAQHRIPMGLARDNNGKPISPYGRIQMVVDGETIDMLFDTGATTALTPAAVTALGGRNRQRATSFITQNVFDRWHKRHPEWRMIEKADAIKGSDLPMIEVPKIAIAGYEVGPVWFTWRPDSAFHEFMAQWMDKPSEGALGGSALHFFRVTVDWITGAATFER